MRNLIGSKKTGKRRKKILFLSLPVLLIVLFFFGAGRFLLYNQVPQQADVIIVLSGGAGRVEKGAELYGKEGYAPYLLLSNAKEYASTSGDMLRTALALGIPPDAILTENAALSTYQNAELTLPVMKQHGFTSAIVISSDFHMRRVKFLFDHVYKDSGIELTYAGSDSGYNAKRWWSDRYSRETIFNEYTKMIGNLSGYNGPEAKSSLEQIKRWFRSQF
ncbi:YdcF family protein [Paenibacillus sp. S150]|uniref:YdcF family protein n=1 Tax=Paenibacillus sp. S150 TaxID=2749826 RepID=UPI001C5915A1|nr:YdcF family protein [Paenibacillus sp. S150]MBW4084536.1 YdcF family protein [Paenibacillus sp. S150]